MSFFFMLVAFWGLLHIPPFGRFVLTRTSRNKAAVAGLVLVIIVVLIAIFAPVLSPHDPLAQDLLAFVGQG